eukprot:SAG31_NODE_319_length_17776_cov_4.703570_9_plen_1168_part_00
MSSLNSSGTITKMSQTQLELENNRELQSVLHTRKMMADSLRQAMLITSSSNGQKGGNRTAGATCYAWGAGANGQLGQPPIGAQLRGSNKPLKVKFIGLQDSVVRVSCGNSHLACITDVGDIHAWGYGRLGQLGYTMDFTSNQPQPKEVDTLLKGPYWSERKGDGSKTPLPMKLVSCGQSHTLALDTDGCLHVWGAGKHGQLGHGRSVPTERVPKMVPFKYKLAQIACGDLHSAAIDSQGRIFTWGAGDAGQLGHGFDKPPSGVPLPEPYLVAGLSHHLGRMAQVACGAQFTAAVSERGELYVWGFGQHLYSTISNNFAYDPEKIRLPRKVKEVGCGRGHMVALTDQGDVFCWGDCEFGQLGHGRKVSINTPRLVLEGKNIVQVDAGRYHTVALNAYGVLYTWGCGESGQLGHGNDSNQLLPRVCDRLMLTVVGQVSCGEHHTAAVCSAIDMQEIDAQMEVWLDNEREEYELKQDAAETCPMGLGKKELQAINFERDSLRLARNLRTEKKVKGEQQVGSNNNIEVISDMKEMKQSIANRIDVREGLDSASSGEGLRPGSAISGFSDTSDTPIMAGGRPASPGQGKPKKREKKKGKSSKKVLRESSSLPDISSTSGAVSPFEEGSVRFDSSIFTQGFEADVGEDGEGPRMDESFFDLMVSRTKQGSKWMETQDRRGSSLVRSCTTLRSTFRKDGSELMKQVRQSISVGDMDMDQWEMQKAFQTMLSLKESYDLTKDNANRKEDKLMSMLTELKNLEMGTQAFNEYVAQQAARVKELRQAFSTVKLNWQEALENKSNYEDILAQLKYDGRMQQMELNRVKRLNSDQKKQLSKVGKLKENAVDQKDSAVKERDTFKDDAEKTMVAFDAYKMHFKQLENTMQLAQERAEQYAIARQKKNEGFSNKAAKKLSNKKKFMEEQLRDQEEKREEADKRRQELEKTYNKLITATNLNDPSDIIDKFYQMENTQQAFHQQIDLNKQRIVQLEKQRTELADEHATLDGSVHARGRWQDIDQKRGILNTKLKELKTKAAQLSQKRETQATYSQGIFALLRRSQGSGLLPENTQLPSQNLEGVVRCLDMIDRMLEAAMEFADNDSAVALANSEPATSAPATSDADADAVQLASATDALDGGATAEVEADPEPEPQIASESSEPTAEPQADTDAVDSEFERA